MHVEMDGFGGMKPPSKAMVALLWLVLLLAGPGKTTACTGDDFAQAVNGAGAALRKLNADNTPRLQAKMRQLKAKMRWAEAGFEDRAYQTLYDERIAAFDTDANALLAKVDALGTVDPAAPPDCGKLKELSAASAELQSTVKARTDYLLAKLDQMLGVAQPQPKSTDAKPPSEAPPKAAAKSPPASGWSAKTTGDPKVAAVPPPPPAEAPRTDEEGYAIEEIRAASAGFFGQVSAGLGSVIEHAFRKNGRPTAYILGTEGGGALVAGVRYGKGLLYLRSGGSQRIFWHGPTLGADVGGEGSKTMILIYKLTAPEDLYASFTAVDGSAYLVGGVGFRLVSNGNVVMAPIRSAVGLRLGASIGYVRFTPKATWNPF
jgi:hypothetical protein